MRTILVAGMILFCASADAQTRRSDAPIFPPGTLTCQQATSPEQIGHARDWLFGYLTAFGESFAPPSVWLGDADTIVSILDQTCAAFPKFTLVEAARWVILTLQDRRYNKKK